MFDIFLILFLCVLLILFSVFLVNYFLNRRSTNARESSDDDDNNNSLASSCSYRLKDSLMTDCEKNYFKSIQSCLPDDYILQPQVNLASIIEKVSYSRFQNELYRNIDFCVFDKTFKPVLLIEINDRSHYYHDRVERDKKVSNICFSAGIPIIRFWTKYGINIDYISSKINSSLGLEE